MANLRRGAPFLVLGIAFVALGATGRRIFLTLGIVCLILGTVRIARPR